MLLKGRKEQGSRLFKKEKKSLKCIPEWNGVCGGRIHAQGGGEGEVFVSESRFVLRGQRINYCSMSFFVVFPLVLLKC